MSIDERVPAGLPDTFAVREITGEITENCNLVRMSPPVLTESEAQQFLVVVQRLASTGISILFITHRPMKLWPWLRNYYSKGRRAC